jgi:hypothetical protein
MDNSVIAARAIDGKEPVEAGSHKLIPFVGASLRAPIGVELPSLTELPFIRR